MKKRKQNTKLKLNQHQDEWLTVKKKPKEKKTSDQEVEYKVEK